MTAVPPQSLAEADHGLGAAPSGSMTVSLAEFFDATHEAMMIHDIETGAVIDVNNRMLEVFRCSREQALDATLDLMIGGGEPYTRERALELIQLAYTEGPQSFVWRPRRADGDLFWADVILRCVTIGDKRRVVATVRDATRMEYALRELAALRGATHDTQLFDKISCQMAGTLGTDIVWIAELDPPHGTNLKTISVVVQGESRPPFMYAVHGTPCAQVLAGQPCCIPEEVTRAFPDDTRLAALGAEAYMGAPICDAHQNPLGIVVAASTQPISDAAFCQTMLHVFASHVESVMARYHAHRAMQTSIDDLKATQAAAHLGSYRWNIQTGDVAWSDELRDIIGLPDVEPSFDLFASLIHPDDRERMLAMGQKALNEDHPFDAEYRIVRPDGSVRHVHDIAQVTRDEHAQPVMMVGTTRDVTPQKVAEEALRDSEERYRLVFNQQYSYMAVLDANGVVIDVNQLALAAQRVERDACVGRRVWEIPALQNLPDSAEHIRQAVARAADSEKPIKFETDLHAGDGAVHTIAATLTAIRDFKGAIRFILAQGMDVTDRKRADELTQMHVQKQDLLLREIEHRVRNNLSSLDTLISLSQHAAGSVEELAQILRMRIRAIASIHAVLAECKWQGADLEKMLEAILAQDDRSRFDVSGPNVVVPNAQAQAFGLVLNELVVNARKHGALNNDGGSVRVSWTIDDKHTDHSLLTLNWHEAGGPQIHETPSPGTGTDLIVGLVRSEFRGDAVLRYPADGADHTITATLSHKATAQCRTDR